MWPTYNVSEGFADRPIVRGLSAALCVTFFLGTPFNVTGCPIPSSISLVPPRQGYVKEVRIGLVGPSLLVLVIPLPQAEQKDFLSLLVRHTGGHG
jgi:hypothetical protein